MAKTSSIERNKKRERLAKQYSAKRAKLKAIADNDSLAMEDRFAARLKLAEMPRNSSKVRIKHRCDLTGRSRSVYRKFRLSRIALRQLASKRFPLEKITTHRFGLKDVDLAIKSVGGHGVPDVIHASLMLWQ